MNYTDENRNSDFLWFLDNYDQFYKEYGRKILAIRNREIIGVFDDKNSAIDVTSQKYDFGSFIVQECNGIETGYTNYITSWELIN